jgi:hypothetical protein
MWEIAFAVAFSAHVGLAGDYNEIHPHIRVSNGGFIAGVFYNSESRVSPYAGYRFEHRQAYAELGLVGGYLKNPVFPYFRVGYDFSDNLSVFAAPAYEHPQTVGAVVGLEIRF